MKINHLVDSSLEVVFKVQETCNINCSYCYMYNMGNEAYKIVPQKQASDQVWDRVADFIVHENVVRVPRYTRIVFHGGEPMLIKPKIFERRMAALWDRLSRGLTARQMERVDLSIQTNGTMVSDDWKAILKRWNLSTGVSLDGPKEVHDRRRKDKKGEGTYDRVMEGIASLNAEEQIRSRGFGALCVIDPEADGAAVYRYLADDAGFRGFNFLLPFMNWDNYDAQTVHGVAAFLVSAFREWCRDVQHGNVRNVRIFLEAVHSLKMLDSKSWEHEISVGHDVIVVECDGTIMTEESLRPTFAGLFSELKVGECTVEDIRTSPQFAQVARDTYTFSEECRGCALRHACRSGAAMGRVGLRYTSTADQLRKSVYCHAFIDLYVEVAAFLKVNAAVMPSVDLRNLESLG